MHPLLTKLTDGITFSGHIPADVRVFFRRYGMDHTLQHCMDVAVLSSELAGKFGLDVNAASHAGWLHDVSAVIPITERVKYASALGLEILPEEESMPMILHQKLSRVFAHEIFGMRDTAVRDAVECHTTLKSDAKPLDKVVFIADKLAWDQIGTPPYADAMQQALEQSVDAAACVYLMYLWEKRDALQVVHPWFVQVLFACRRGDHLRSGGLSR